LAYNVSMEDRYFRDLQRMPRLDARQQLELARAFRFSVHACERVLDEFPAGNCFAQDVLTQIRSGKPAEKFLRGVDSSTDRNDLLKTLTARASGSQTPLLDWGYRPDRIYEWCQQLIGVHDNLRSELPAQAALAAQTTVGQEQESRMEVEAIAGMSLDQLRQCVAQLQPLVIEAQRSLDQLVECNLLLVVAISQRFENRGGDTWKDLVQEGSIALMHAAAAYDPDSGPAKFSSFAWQRIAGRMLNWLADCSRTVRLPSNARKLVQKVWRLRKEAANRGLPEPSDEELAQLIGVSAEDIETAHGPNNISSLEESCGDDGATLGENLIGQEGVIIDELPELRGQLEALIAICGLRPRHEIALRLHFGLYQPGLIRDVAMALKVTCKREDQIKAKQLGRARSSRRIVLAR
jgi:RNA polymerase primary sigma factor